VSWAWEAGELLCKPSAMVGPAPPGPEGCGVGAVPEAFAAAGGFWGVRQEWPSLPSLCGKLQ